MDINTYDHNLVRAFVCANDNNAKLLNYIRAVPDRALKEAVILDNHIQFKMALSMGACSQRGLNEGLFYAIGVERDHFMRELIGAGAKLPEVVNGMLLNHVLKGNIAGVRFCLREGVDVNAHNEECFKQAILGNNLEIADMLHGHGADLTQVMSDPRFVNLLWDIDLVQSETRNFFYELVGNFDFSLRHEL